MYSLIVITSVSEIGSGYRHETIFRKNITLKLDECHAVIQPVDLRQATTKDCPKRKHMYEGLGVGFNIFIL